MLFDQAPQAAILLYTLASDIPIGSLPHAKAMRASSIFKSRVCERLNFIDEPLEVYPLLSNFIATNPKRPFA